MMCKSTKSLSSFAYKILIILIISPIALNAGWTKSLFQHLSLTTVNQFLSQYFPKSEKTETAVKYFWLGLKSAIDLDNMLAKYHKEIGPQINNIVISKQSAAEKQALIQSINKAWHKNLQAISITRLLQQYLLGKGSLGTYPPDSESEWITRQFAEIFSAQFRPDFSRSSSKHIYGKFDFNFTPTTAEIPVKLESGTLTLKTNIRSKYQASYEGQISLLGGKIHLILSNAPKIYPEIALEYQKNKRKQSDDQWISAFMGCLLGSPLEDTSIPGWNWSPYCLVVHKTPDLEWKDLGLIVTVALNLNGLESL